MFRCLLSLKAHFNSILYVKYMPSKRLSLRHSGISQAKILAKTLKRSGIFQYIEISFWCRYLAAARYWKIFVFLWQVGAREDQSGLEHENWSSFRECSLWGTRTLQVAVRCVVQRCHPCQPHGIWGDSWVRNIKMLTYNFMFHIVMDWYYWYKASRKGLTVNWIKK